MRAGVGGRSNPAELAGMLVGTGQALPVARPGAPPSPEARRLNGVLGRRVRSVIGPSIGGGLASAMLGAALPAQPIEQFVCARVLDGEDVGWLEEWEAALSDGLDGEQYGKLRAALLKILAEKMPAIQALGVI